MSATQIFYFYRLRTEKMARRGGGKKSSARKKKKPSTRKRPTKSKKNSPLKKTNKRSNKQKMRRGDKKIASSKQKMQQTKQQHSALMKKESEDFNKKAMAIKGDKSLSKEERRKKLTAAQLQRRQREKASTQRLNTHRQLHSETKQRTREMQREQMERYRQRKRAVDFSDRQLERKSSTRVTNFSTAQAQAQAQVIGVGGMGYAPQPYGAPGVAATSGYFPPQAQAQPQFPMGGGQPQPPFQTEDEMPAIQNETEEQIGDGEVEMRSSGQRQLIPTRGVVLGIEEPEEDIEIPDIPALREVDPRMMRQFMLARLRFERAVTNEEKIKYSTEFFEIAAKMDRMFHVHAAMFHKITKYRPPTWNVTYAGTYANELSKETLEELSRLTNKELSAYLASL